MTPPSRPARFIARDDLLTLKQAAELTGLAPRAIRYLADHHKIAYEVVEGSPRRRRFRRSVLAGLLRQVPAEPRAQAAG